MRILQFARTLLPSIVASLCFSAVAQVPVQLDRVVAAPDMRARLAVPGHVPAWAKASSGVTDLGTVPDSQPILVTFGVSRAPGVQAAFDQLLVDLQTPSSARYHQFLTPQQIGEQYGPTQHDLDALTTWLTGQGFHVDNVTPSRLQVQATAPAAVVSSVLGTSLHRFSVQVGGKTELRQAPTSEPLVPAALAPIVATIGGLVDLPRHSDLKILPPVLNTETNIRTPQAFGGSTSPGISPNMTLGDGSHYIAPADFTVLYDLSPVYNAGITGTGQKIMVIGGSRLFPQDLEYWEYDSGLTTSLTNYVSPNYIVPTGQTDPGTTNDSTMAEATLDFERAYATAPGATVDMVIASNVLSTTVFNAVASYMINTVNDPVMTASFSLCETGAGSATVQAGNTLYAQAAAQGISVFFSSGDGGADGCEGAGATPSATQFLSINGDCATGNVTCVGGTEFADTASPSTYWSSTNGTGLESALSYIPEGAWNEPSGTNSKGATIYDTAASGGGPSIYIAKPTWQTGTGVPADGQRDTPDVSFSASSHNAYFSCLNFSGASCVPSNGSFVLTGFGGTSASAPSMAGIAALVDQKLGKRQGNLNPTLYSIAASTPSAFHDATPATSGVATCAVATPSMCNNSDPSSTALTGGLAGYALTTGYDLATGLGSLDVSKFINAAFAATSLLSATATLTATPSAITTAQTVVLKATVASTTTGTPTGTVVFTSNGTTLATVTLSGGTASTAALSFPTVGTYAIVATYSGDTTFAGTASSTYTLAVSASGTTKSTSTLTATATTAAANQTVGLTATITGASGTPTGTVQFTLDGAKYGAAVTTSGGVATAVPALFATGSHTLNCTYSGDNIYASSTCNPVALTVTGVASATSITIAPATVGTTGTTIIGGTVTGGSGSPTPTGTLTLFNVTTNAAYGALPLTSGSVSGSLTVSSIPLGLGSYQLELIYSGDSVYAPSTSPQSTLTVANSNPTISMTPAAGSITQTAGGSSTDVVTVTSANFTGTQTLTCAVTFNGPGTATDLPVCAFNPGTLNFTGSGSFTSTVTVTSTAASAYLGGVMSARNRRLDLTGLGGAAFAGVLLLCLPRRGRKAVRTARLMAAILFLAAGFVTLSGCGSGGSTGSSSNPGTTKGSYDININANSALNQPGNVGYSTFINLTIQ